jgi:hypothetical protein
MSSLKDGTLGAVGVNTMQTKPWGGSQNQAQTSQAQPSEKKKWRCVCRPFRTNSLKEGQCNVYSHCYATIVRRVVISHLFLGNGSVNTFPWQQLHMQQGRKDVVYAVRTESL